MIILRYLTRELLITTISITAILVVVIMSGDFTRYLWEAISGKIDAGVLMALIAYRIPNFLELILPLGFFVAILMVYGRLYAEQEMTVLFSCGLSRVQLVAITYAPALIVAIVTGFVSLWLTPYGLQESELIKEQQKSRSDLDLLQPARFQPINNGQLISYVESIDDNNKDLNSVFIASMGAESEDDLIVIRAKSAARIDDPLFSERYLVLKEGIRYQGRPGQQAYRVTEFSRFSQHIEQAVIVDFQTAEIKARSTAALWQENDNKSTAALQWRFSAPTIVLVVALLGVGLSHTTPRRGRYAMLFPSILLYTLYVVSLNAVRGMVEEGRFPPEIGLWFVHGLFFVLAVIVFILKGGFRIKKRASKESKIMTGAV